MPSRDRLLQERVKDLETVSAHTRRAPLAVAAAIAAAAILGLAWLVLTPRSAAFQHALAVALVIVLAAMVAAVAFLAEVFLRWKDRFAANYVALAARRVEEFEESSDGVLIVNGQGRIEAANAAAERILGQSRQTLGGLPVTDVLALPATAGQDGFLRSLEAQVGPLMSAVMREMSARRADGDDTPVDVTVRSLWMADGQYVGFYLRDISERKRVERLKDEFVSTVSHELRTPLTSIAGSLGLLAGGVGGPLAEGPSRLIGIAHSNCQRLIRLINDMLDIEKIESGKMKFEMAPVTLEDVAQRSIDAVRGLSDQLNVGIDLKVGAGEGAPARGDVDRLVQVGANLISNALKFSKAGDRVTVSVVRQGRLARLSVKDRGPGIPEEFRSRIFTKFAQADSSDTRQKGGTGLGLVIAREIVERHGGRLWFESAPGAGACFHADLPIADPLEASRVEGGGHRLLVCEDDADAAEVLKQTLERDGFAVDVVGRAADALAALSVRHPYDALLLDLLLPDGNGLDLIQMLRSRPSASALPIIVISAQAEKGRKSAGAGALNVVDWMEKPIDLARLRRAVADALARSALPRRPVILHVDDDHDILSVTAAALATAGEVVSVESLASARAFMTARTPDLVILDLALGDGSGLELLAELHDASGTPIPVLIFSARDTDQLVLSRVCEVITKSRTSLDALAAAVRRLIETAPSPPASAPARLAS